MAAPPVSAPTHEIGTPDFFWGTWGQGLLTEWWETVSDLIWPQSVITYGRMRHDPQLKAVIAAFLWPMMRANWGLDSSGCRPEVTQHCADQLGLPVIGAKAPPGPARRRGVIWSRHLRQVSQKFVFGHMPFERVYAWNPATKLFDLSALGPRMPWTLASIRLNRDGSVLEVTQTTQDEPIPARNLVWYSHELEGSAWAGISALRPAFGAWLLKHESWRVLATSNRRFGMGVPSVTAPPGATGAQVQEAQSLASSMRVGDQSGVGLPAGFTFGLIGLSGSVPDGLAFVKYLDQQMSKMMLAGLVDLGQTETGSRALGETFLDLFLLALRGLADEVATEATSGYPGTEAGSGMPGIVTDLVDVNWGPDEPAPRIVCGDVGEQHQTTAQSIMQLLQWGGLTADPNLERRLRELWNLPQRETPQPKAQPTGHLSDLAPSLAPAPAPPAVQPAAGRVGRGPIARAAAAASLLRRQLTPTEVRAGFDPVAHQADWQDARDRLIAHWGPVSAAQRDALVDQVIDLVDGGHAERLAALNADSSEGAALLKASMLTVAEQAASQLITEAEHQGVTIDPAKVRISDQRLGQVAQTRAALAAAYVSQQAGQRAIQMVAAAAPAPPPAEQGQPVPPPPVTGLDVGDYVATQLDALSGRSLSDQLGAALTAAQNAGRTAVMEAAPQSAGSAVYVATEVLDVNTCDPCRAEDGAQYDTLAAAAAAYPAGGFLGCAGYERCRGTVMPVWGGA